MIGVLCADLRLRREIEKDILLLGREIATAIELADLERAVQQCECTVVVIGGARDEESLRTLLRRMVRDPAGNGAASWPVLVVGEESYFAAGEWLRSISQETLDPSEVATELIDALARETARAAINFLERQSQSMEMSAILRGAVIAAMLDSGSIRNVRALARQIRIAASTLHHHWKAERLQVITGLTLKEFLDVVLLLKVRARLTPQLKVSEVAAEFGTTERHVMARYRVRVGSWRERNRGGWLQLPRQVRSWRWSECM